VRGYGVWLSWSIDALLVLAMVLVLLAATWRLPFCPRCQRWYSTMRSALLAPDTARQVAELTGLPGVEVRQPVRYRLSNCLGACSPGRLVLVWQEPSGRNRVERVWLDVDARKRVLELLDRDCHV